MQIIILRKILGIFFLLILFAVSINAQTGCTTLGQTPATAFPVCGTKDFHQETVPQCSNGDIYAYSCGHYPDTNPFWYRFTCYESGTLGFLIIPKDINDDYDWQLFDVTGHSPEEVYTDGSLFVTANWSGSSGATGTLAINTNIISCGSDPAANVTTFSKMPEIIKGHAYLLLVSHFTQTQSGYSLSFKDGTAIITDTLKPNLGSATANCSGEIVFVKLNKKVQCASLAKNGTDFIISPALANVKSATGINCNNSFDMDSVQLVLDKPLPQGNYSLIIKNGSDQNTLLDNCGTNIPENANVPFTVYPVAPTPMDSLVPVSCAPQVLQLVFKTRMRCNSIAPNGSDFEIRGTYPVSVIGAAGDSCNDGLSNTINIRLDKPLLKAGNFIITLKQGSDSNTLINECDQVTPANSTINFITADTVSADFSFETHLGCKYDTLVYAHNGKNGVNEWNWIFDKDGTSNIRDSIFLFSEFGPKHIQLAVSNNVCTDTASADILLDNELEARYTISPSLQLCPEDAAVFTDSSIGKIVSWYWIFGDGRTSTLRQPDPKNYPAATERNGRIYPTALVVKNDIGCFDTASINIKVFSSCYIAVPSAFTPNGDGLNDYLYPLNAYKADNLEFRVFNRWGQLVFETKDWTKKWDGKINGSPQASGTYVWYLHYTNRDSQQQFSLKGTTVLIR